MTAAGGLPSRFSPRPFGVFAKAVAVVLASAIVAPVLITAIVVNGSAREQHTAGHAFGIAWITALPISTWWLTQLAIPLQARGPRPPRGP